MVPKGEDHTIRYLGMWVNLGLDWSVQVTRLDRTAGRVCAIRRNKFTLPMSVSALQQYLYPCLQIGLSAADVSPIECSPRLGRSDPPVCAGRCPDDGGENHGG